MTVSPGGYKPTARALHWIAAILILAMLPIGGVMTQEGLDRGTQNLLYILHKNGGVILLLLMVLRLAYRLLNPPPPLPATVAPWQLHMAGLSHTLLYAMVFFMALTGFVRVQAGGFPIELLDALGVGSIIGRDETVANIAKTAHFYGRFVLIALVVLHVGAALQHALVRRDGVFGRIWPIRPRG